MPSLKGKKQLKGNKIPSQTLALMQDHNNRKLDVRIKKFQKLEEAIISMEMKAQETKGDIKKSTDIMQHDL